MKIANTKIKKAFIIVIASIIIAITLVIIFLSPLEKYLAEKYAQKYLGRRITMSWIYINPFTGYVHISDLKIYESKKLPEFKVGDSLFFSSKGVSATFSLLKLLSKTVQISKITLDRPRGIIIQDNKEVNFRDLIKTFTPVKPSTGPPKFHFNIKDISVIKGEFYYREKNTPFSYFIKNVNLKSTGKQWNSDTMAVKFFFISGPATGEASGNITINFKTLDFRLATIIHRLDLKFLEQYLKSLSNYGTFVASLDANIKATGNFTDKENLIARGFLKFNDFHIGKIPGDDYASFDKLLIQIIELSPNNHKYNFDTLLLLHPFFKYERYDHLDNLQRMFGEKGTNLKSASSHPEKFNLILTLANYLKGIVKNFFQSEYNINRLAIYNGDFKYSDFAISEKFMVDLNPLTFVSDSIGKNQKQVAASLQSGIQPYGKLSVTLNIIPKDKGDFTVHYNLQKLPVSLFNPYVISYTSFSLDRGTIELKGVWNVRNAVIQSVNHLLIIDPRKGGRLRNKDEKWLPLPLIMSLIRDRGNVIDYEIPITGDLKNPKFHLKDVIVDLLENIFVKPATTAYRVEVKSTETEIEKSLAFKWKMRQSTILPEQEKFIGAMVAFLVKNPDATINIHPIQYTEKEKEYIQFFEAKKKYYLLMNHEKASSFNEDDSLKVDKMSVKDSSFVRYLDKIVRDTMLFTIQEKCSRLTGSALVDDKFKQLMKAREDAFLSAFKKESVSNRVKFYAGENAIPYNGFSFYKIDYKSEFPEALLEANLKMSELNDEAPRKKYENDRKEISKENKVRKK